MIYFQSQVDRLLKAKEDQIVDLKWQLARMKEEFEIERKRANAAVDNLLYMAGAGKITKPAELREPSRYDALMAQVSEGLSHIGGEVEGRKEETV